MAIGPDRDIPASDVGTNQQIMAWIVDEYSIAHGHSPAVVTGKPVTLGGTKGRQEATGRDVAMVAELLAKDLKKPLVKISCAIQEFGNVGSYTVSFLWDKGVKVVG